MQTFSFTVWPAAGQGGGLHLPGAGLFPTATLQSPSEDPPDPPPCTGPQPVHLVHSSRPRGLSSPITKLRSQTKSNHPLQSLPCCHGPQHPKTWDAANINHLRASAEDPPALITPLWSRVTNTEEGNLRCECPWEAGKLEAPLWRKHMPTLGTTAKDTVPVLL